MEHARVPADLLCVTIHADVRNVGMALLCVRVRYGTYVAGPKQKRLGAVQSEKRVGRTAFFRAVEWKEERCGVGVGYQSRVPSMPCVCYIVPYLATIPRVALTASVFEDAKDTAAACVCYAVLLEVCTQSLTPCLTPFYRNTPGLHIRGPAFFFFFLVFIILLFYLFYGGSIKACNTKRQSQPD